MEHNNFIDFLKKNFKVTKNADGSYSLQTESETYRITKDVSSEDPFKPCVHTPRAGSSSSQPSFPRIGQDDIMPDFDQKIKKKDKFKGMYPTPSDFGSTDSDTPFDIDPAYPSRKKKNKGPEPDPDNFDPGRQFDTY